MQPLNFSSYKFRFKKEGDITYIFDPIREKFVVLQPEEWVRQHVLQFLIKDLLYPQSLINVEKNIKVAAITRRYDVVCYRPDGSMIILVECKAPSVSITQNTFDQIAQYNFSINADYLMISNGLRNYFCRIDYESKKYIFLESLPHYQTL